MFIANFINLNLHNVFWGELASQWNTLLHLAVLSLLLYVNALKLHTTLTFHFTKSCGTHADTIICWLPMVQKFMMEPC